MTELTKSVGPKTATARPADAATGAGAEIGAGAGVRAGSEAGSEAGSGSGSGAGAEPALAQVTQWGEIRARFMENKLAVVGLFLITLLFLTAVFAPLIAPHDPYHQDLNSTLQSPNGTHWLGTDVLGRDQFSRIVHGSRIAVVVGLASIFLATVIGVVIGAISGYFGKAADTLLMRSADIFLAFPLLIGAIVIILWLGRGVLPVIISLAVFSWPTVSRLLRSSILSVREADYVLAARALGAGTGRILTRHILPNSLAAVMTYAAFSVGSAIVAEASLSFLGVGVSPETPEWGNMISAARDFMGIKDYLWLYPSIAIVLTVLGFVFVGDGLRDALDPKLR